MVANLSAHKRGWDDNWEFFSDWGEKGMILQQKLIDLVDDDTDAFNSIMNAFSLPKDSDQEKKFRIDQIQLATRNAIEIPFKIMEVCFDSLSLIHEMAKKGNPNSITDVGVAMYCIKAAINGAFLNVRINCNDLNDKVFIKETLSKANEILKITDLKEKEVLKIVDEKL